MTHLEGYFPILLKLEDRLCLVVGGGFVAERRIAALLEAKAKVKVVSPRLTDAIARWAEQGLIVAEQRPYEPADQAGAYLVVAATDSVEVNDAVWQLAQKSNQLINMAERSERGDFIVPSVVRRGKLVIAVSTLGASPSVAASIRRQLERSFGQEYEVYLDFLSEFRLKVQELVKDTKVRQEWFRAVLQADLLGMIHKGEFEAWKRRMLEELETHPQTCSVRKSGGEACAESL